VAWRVCGLFLGEKAVKAADVASLADGLRQRNLDVGWAVETVLRSRAFFAADNLGDRVLGPVEYVIGAARALELFDPPSSTLVLAEWTGRLGQDLFYPPNVGGWPGVGDDASAGWPGQLRGCPGRRPARGSAGTDGRARLGQAAQRSGRDDVLYPAAAGDGADPGLERASQRSARRERERRR